MAHLEQPAQHAPNRPPRGAPALPALALALALGAAAAEAGAATPAGEGSGAREDGRRIVFIDPAVPDREALIAGIPPSAEVVVLEPGRDGVAQIAERLGAWPGSRGGGSIIDLVSHGSPGELLLGGAVLDPASPRGPHARLLAEIGAALGDGARILVYGCRFGDGERGRRAVRALAEATGAAVAASDDVTGSRSLAGDWDLEVTIGHMAAPAAVVGEEARASWRGTLQALPSVRLRDGAGNPLTSLDVGEDAGTVTFRVELSAAAAGAVMVDWGTVEEGGRPAAPGSDYRASVGTLTFAPGETSKDIAVEIIDDNLDEEDEERFRVVLSNPIGARFSAGAPSVVVAIQDNDALPVVSIADAEASEGDGAVVFTVTLTPASAREVILSYRTQDQTASAPGDYTSFPPQGALAPIFLTFDPGDTTKQIRIPVIDDSIREGDETFDVVLSRFRPANELPAHSTLRDPVATGTIRDNEAGPVLSIAGTTVDEDAGSATFEVTLTGASTQAVTVDYATSDGTAEAPGDYTASSGTLTFPVGTTTRMVDVPVIDDTDTESPETFTVTLSGATNAGLGQASAAATILDDDGGAGAALSIGDASVSEADGVARLTVTLTGTSGGAVTVDYATMDGTAEDSSDYTAAMGTLTFPAGTTTQDLFVTVLNDETPEADEAFTVALSGAAGAALGRDTAAVTIIDDDGDGEVPALVPPSAIPEMSRAMLASALEAVASCLAQAERGQGAGAESLANSLSARSGQPRREAMADSPFGLALADGEGAGTGGISICGSGDYRRLSTEGAADWEGGLFGAHLGAGVQLRDGFRAGILVSRYDGSLDYTDRSGGRTARGTNDIRLTGIQPYLGWSAPDGSRLWATAGHGIGEIDAEESGGPRLSSDVTHTTAAVGGSLRLDAGGRSPPGGGIRLELKGEAGFGRLDVDGNGPRIPGEKAGTHRIRLALGASRDHALASGATVALSAELGARHDGGDGETGSGVEAGAGLGLSDPARGLAAEANGRVLVAHGSGLDEWGLGASVRFDPGSDGHGPQFSVLPAWGEPEGGIARLWESGTAPREGRRTVRLGMEAGYGAPVPGGPGTLTLYGGLDLLDGGRQGYRAGSRIDITRETGLSLEGRILETPGRGTDHGIFLEGRLRL